MRTPLAALALLAALTGCSGGSQDVSDVEEGLPSCSSVWTVGETLPADYDGCTDGDTIVVAVSQSCTSGEDLVSYDDQLVARYGGTIEVTDSTACLG